MYNQPVMLVSRFDELRRHKSYVEKRDLPLRTIAKEAKLSLTTVNRVSRGDVLKVNVSTLESLCKFFQVKTISELVEYIPEAENETEA
jgi:DNA-binding Xre family transcriptional regulator